LTPACPVLPPRYDAIADAADPAAWRTVALLAHTAQPASYLGLPALAVPFTLSASGLPIGMQLIGRPHAEDTLFAAAAPLERHFASLDATPPAAP
ncbi:MAG: AtzE family amidohydrolase, partial [Proteobacteria bacterium]|nr:AtzE family amidohydrolase [Pseudomonadota bacterium]